MISHERNTGKINKIKKSIADFTLIDTTVEMHLVGSIYGGYNNVKSCFTLTLNLVNKLIDP